LYVALVVVFTKSTSAPGIDAPEVSVTSPVKDATSWAMSTGAQQNATRTKSKHAKSGFFIFLNSFAAWRR
jgi:hypothetical protein